jgi:hypothetical protein
MFQLFAQTLPIINLPLWVGIKGGDVDAMYLWSIWKE